MIGRMRSLIQSLMPTCRHQFAWPRRDERGEHYQVCILCGAKYSYDWTTMRRVAPLTDEEEQAAEPAFAHRKCGKKRAWVPRERRLRHEVPVQFRHRGSHEWSEGVSENISRSGLLFHAASALEVGSELELMLELPQELTGEADAPVACEAVVVRVEQVPATRTNKQVTYKIACSVAQYRFLQTGE